MTLRDETETYHGLPVLHLRSGEGLPAPRAPQRFAVRVSPDLARYLLAFNHERNRKPRLSRVRRYAADMAANKWLFTPESIVFSRSGVLQNGQNRLLAVTEAGAIVWMVMDFGWADDIIYALDLGAARTSGDALTLAGVFQGTSLAGAYSKVHLWETTVGTPRSWVGIPLPSALTVKEAVAADMDLWEEAARLGQRLYRVLDHGWGTATWVAGFVILSRHASPDEARAFFDDLIEGRGAPKSATRDLLDWARRRPIGNTRSGDQREPLELLVRAFNGWHGGRRLSIPKMPGFVLSRIYKRGASGRVAAA